MRKSRKRKAGLPGLSPVLLPVQARGAELTAGEDHGREQQHSSVIAEQVPAISQPRPCLASPGSPSSSTRHSPTGPDTDPRRPWL